MNPISFLIAHHVGAIVAWCCLSLVNAMSNYPGPNAHGLAVFLHYVLDAVSFLSKANVQQGLFGFLKLPIFHRAGNAPKAAPAVSVAGGGAVRGYAIPWLLPVLVLGIPLLLVAALRAVFSRVETYPEMKRRWRRKWGHGSAGSVALLMLCLGAVYGLASCAALKPLPGQLLNCGESVAPSAIATVAPQVGQVLSGQSPTWQSDLSSLITNVGLPAVECAVQQLVGDLSSKSTSSALSPKEQVAYVRAQAWLAGVQQGAGH